jgi:hypothetical protein
MGIPILSSLRIPPLGVQYFRSCILVHIFILRIPLLVSVPRAELKVALTAEERI